LKLARTIADLAGVDRIQAAPLAEAIHLRLAEKAELTAVQRRTSDTESG
jgi:predicted ATPase with chaperone activity